jgi:tetratricopeptide (TPR) repeat protein
MATGAMPFRGESSGMIFDAILNRAPVSAVRLNPDVPAELERIINKCLEKDRNLRYQHACDVGTDLQRLKRDAESSKLVALNSGKVALPAGRGGLRVAVGIVILVAVLSVSGYLFIRRPSTKLTKQNTLLLTDFVNTTGDSVFDQTLKQALTVQLEQSPYVSLVSEQDVREFLKYMGLSEGEHVTKSRGLEICQRGNMKAILVGSIANLGSQYVIGLEALDCQSGNVLASEQAQASSKEQVLDAVGKTASRIRERLGESLTSIQNSDKPLTEATTSSIEALKAYSMASKAMWAGKTLQCIPFLERAIALDQEFGAAYKGLAEVYSTVGESERAADYASKAYNLRDHLSEPERLGITSMYHQMVTGSLEEEMETEELWKQEGPSASSPSNYLLFNYSTYFGDYERAVEVAKNAQTYTPGTLAGAYLGLNRVDEAKSILDQAIARKFDNPNVRGLLFEVAALQGEAFVWHVSSTIE